MSPVTRPEEVNALRQFDTCTVANAIETLNVRLRNEGFTGAGVRCLFPGRPAMVGHAVTLRIRCSSPPPDRRSYYDRTDWWNFILTIPAPRVVVIQDVDEVPGTGSFLGEVHASILLALGCVGAVTNGAVRDVPAVERSGFQFFAAGVAVSHAYAHIVSIGDEVEVAGLRVRLGDLLHGDTHGVVSVPPEIAPQIPAVAAGIIQTERALVALCRSPDFSLEKLRAAVANL